MPNVWSSQAYGQVFDFEAVTFNQTMNIFENTEIYKSIFEGVVEFYFKAKTTRV